MTKTAPKRMTLAQVRELPATVDVPTAAGVLGISKSTLYEAVSSGMSPVRTVTVGRRVVVITADLIRVVEGGGDDPG